MQLSIVQPSSGFYTSGFVTYFHIFLLYFTILLDLQLYMAITGVIKSYVLKRDFGFIITFTFIKHCNCDRSSNKRFPERRDKILNAFSIVSTLENDWHCILLLYFNNF